VEPFGGSAGVLLNRDPSPIEVYNDLNEDVVNFFRILRERPEELIESLRMTPYAVKEFENCKQHITDPLERARCFFVRARQSFMSTGRTWAISKYTRGGWGQMISRWDSGIDGLGRVVARLRHVIFECRPAVEVMFRHDDDNTVMYLDPPYLQETRVTKEGYGEYEMDRSDHIEILSQAKVSDALIAISGYDNDLYNHELKDWFRYEDKEKQLAGPRTMRQEILWTNYDPAEVVDQNQTRLEEFD